MWDKAIYKSDCIRESICEWAQTIRQWGIKWKETILAYLHKELLYLSFIACLKVCFWHMQQYARFRFDNTSTEAECF